VDVAVWLKSLGLGQYETAFRDNAIEGDLLPNLTAEDLKDLGVTIVGHRRKLLDAIAALGAATKPTSPPAAANPPSTLPLPPASSRLQARSDTSAQRRLLTVLFCDLVGSAAISASLDAEDWRNLVSAYLDAASEAVTQLGGRVAKKLGDGLMALFGHPIAQENDSERAVRAALAIQRSLAELNHNNTGSGRPELVARIGVETGAVVVCLKRYWASGGRPSTKRMSASASRSSACCRGSSFVSETARSVACRRRRRGFGEQSDHRSAICPRGK
jgi:class 3 adenylate cyclase